MQNHQVTSFTGVWIEIATKKAQLKAHKWLKTALFDLAERVGFEPTRPFGLTDFESAPL